MRLDDTFLRPTAHRGLHDAEAGIIENTADACQNAIKHGYAIEVDVQAGYGGLPFVFHDATLNRLTTATGRIDALTQEAARTIKFRHGSTVGIPTLTDVLAAVAGRVPILVEVKNTWTPPDDGFVRSIVTATEAYTGPIALMCFDPAYLSAFKRLAPTIPRGLVSGAYREPDGTPWWPDQLSDGDRQALAALTSSDDVDPSFYAYDVRALPRAELARLRQTQRRPVFAWTVRTAEQQKTAAAHADAIIFENVRP